MIMRQDLGAIELLGCFFTEGNDYERTIKFEGITLNILSSTIHRNLGSVECMGEYFRTRSGEVLSTELYEQLIEKPGGEFIYPPRLKECLGKSKTSELIVARQTKTGKIVGTLLNYVTDIQTAYNREFKAHYPGQLRCIELALHRYYGSSNMDLNIFSSIGVNTDINGRLRLIVMLKMVRMWANQLITHKQDSIPGLAEMNRGANTDKENGFFRACKKNFGIEDLDLTSNNGKRILAKDNQSTYNSTMTTFGKGSILRMANT